jgi:DNA-binding XRE family transcriptional regulator
LFLSQSAQRLPGGIPEKGNLASSGYHVGNPRLAQSGKEYKEYLYLKLSAPMESNNRYHPSANLIGERVRWVREKLQLTQDQLAGRLAKYGVQLDYVKIGQVEKGKRRVIDKELVAFAKALGVSVTWLLSGDESHL